MLQKFQSAAGLSLNYFGSAKTPEHRWPIMLPPKLKIAMLKYQDNTVVNGRVSSNRTGKKMGK